ncbi:MAG: FtsH protease activity modulator HflK [bacterium]
MAWDPFAEDQPRGGGGGVGGGGGGDWRPGSFNLDPRRLRSIIIGVVAAILLIATVVTSGYSIEPEEEGVVLRFGRYSDTVQPGFHFKLPFGIDSVHRVATRTVHKEEFGFRTKEPGKQTTYSEQKFPQESLILTGDLNIADVSWVVQYRIKDPRAFLFRNEEPEKTLRDMSESIMRSVVGDRTVDEVLTVGRSDVEAQVKDQLQQKMDQYQTGITVVALQLQNVNPPEKVQGAFNDVNKALQDKEKLVNEARREFNRLVPTAEGFALRRVQEAEGYRSQRVNQALGDTVKFTRIYEEYLRAPDVTRRRLYLEAMGEVLPKLDQVLLVEGKGAGLLPFFDVGQKPAAAAAPGGAR